MDVLWIMVGQVFDNNDAKAFPLDHNQVYPNMVTDIYEYFGLRKISLLDAIFHKS